MNRREFIKTTAAAALIAMTPAVMASPIDDRARFQAMLHDGAIIRDESFVFRGNAPVPIDFDDVQLVGCCFEFEGDDTKLAINGKGCRIADCYFHRLQLFVFNPDRDPPADMFFWSYA